MIKMDIENRMLFPLLVLIIVPIISIGILSYRNAHQMSVGRELNHMDHLLEMVVLTSEKNLLLDGFVGYDFSFVVDDGGRFGGNTRGHVVSDEQIMSYRYYQEDQGYLTLSYDRQRLSQSLFDFQKDSMIVAIVSMLLSTQVIIILTNSISTPLRRMRRTCERIEQGVYERMTMHRRKDELGVLATSFNHMMDTITDNTAKIRSLQAINQKVLENAPVGLFLLKRGQELEPLNKIGVHLEETSLVERQTSLGFQAFIKELPENGVYQFKEARAHQAVYLDLSTAPMGDQEIIISVHDISKRRMLEEQVERMEKLSSLGRLTASLAHEIRNPLSGVRAGVQLLYKRYDLGGESTPIYSMLVSEIDRLNHLIDEMLDFSKPTVTRQEPCRIHLLLEDTLELLHGLLEEERVLVDVQSSLEWEVSNVDPGQIKQVMINLLKNAVSAMDKEEPAIAISLYNTEDPQGYRKLHLEIQDNGCGMGEEDMKMLFDPFFTRFEKGTGLGLSIVQRLMSENHGSIVYESTVGEGTLVTLTFEVYHED